MRLFPIKLCAINFDLSRDNIINSSIGSFVARQRTIVFLLCSICFSYVLVIINRQGTGRSSSAYIYVQHSINQLVVMYRDRNIKL
jgi:hypothetical protein